MFFHGVPVVFFRAIVVMWGDGYKMYFLIEEKSRLLFLIVAIMLLKQ